MQKLLSRMRLFLPVRRTVRRLYRRFRPKTLQTAIAGHDIQRGELVYIVGKRAYGVNPSELTKKRP